MSELTKKFEYFKKMSPLKKTLIVFIILLIFIIVVEQPGSDTSKREKSTKYFIPTLVIEEVKRISIDLPYSDKDVDLEKEGENWRVKNGHLFPADENKVNSFLEMLHGLKEVELTSKNPDRMSVFGVDELSGTSVAIWDQMDRKVVDFYAGKGQGFNSQYLRKADSDKVIKVSQNLNLFLLFDSNEWKDKTLLSIEETDVRRIALKNPDEELILEKKENVWRVTQPEDYEADSLSIRTLFEQLKQVRADGFADAVEGSQADFENPDYKVSVRLMDDSLKLISFSETDEEGRYYAKNGKMDMIYTISQESLDNIFDLNFKPEEEVVK